MSKLSDKVSYLRGLADGMKLNMDKDANKLIVEILGVLGDVAEELQELSDAHDELNDYVESLDDDLADLEDALFDEDDDDEHDEDCDCPECVGEGESIIYYACPECGHAIEFRAEDIDFDEDYLCPACGKPVFPEVDDDEEGEAENEGEDEAEDVVDVDPEE